MWGWSYEATELREQSEGGDETAQSYCDRIHPIGQARFKRGHICSKLGSKLDHFGLQFAAKPRDIRFCCVVLTLLYGSGDGFRLGAVHAGGFERPGGLEGVKSSGSHSPDYRLRRARRQGSQRCVCVPILREQASDREHTDFPAGGQRQWIGPF